MSLPLDYVTDHLQHGYARTVHKTQGLTCEVALLLGDDTLYAELGYTGLTRGSDENHLYAVAVEPSDPDGQALDHVIRALDTSRAKTAADRLPRAGDSMTRAAGATATGRQRRHAVRDRRRTSQRRPSADTGSSATSPPSSDADDCCAPGSATPSAR